MYDILQLNDMLVPELKDIAEGLKVENHLKLNKQELIYKILDKQALSPEPVKVTTEEHKPKARRRKVSAPAEEVITKEEEPTPVPEPAGEGHMSEIGFVDRSRVIGEEPGHIAVGPSDRGPRVRPCSSSAKSRPPRRSRRPPSEARVRRRGGRARLPARATP